jgi:hypothetical protein
MARMIVQVKLDFSQKEDVRREKNPRKVRRWMRTRMNTREDTTGSR